MKTYNLLSSPLVHTPGYVNWLRHFPKSERKKALKMLMDVYGLPKPAAEKVLNGDCTVDGETIKVTLDEGEV